MASQIKSVQKRDGRVVPFDKSKIADAIFKAAQSVGGQDRYLAEDLAEAVTMYLEKEFDGRTPTVEEIQDVVEKVLIKTGHARTAKSYILYRERRARIRRVRQGIRPEDLAEEEAAVRKTRELADIKWSVRRSDECLVEWNTDRIVEALIKETGLSRNIAEIIVIEVEEEIAASKIRHLTSALIRELVNAKLVAYGFEEERRRHSRLGVPRYDVQALLTASSDSPDETTRQLGSHIKKEFALTEVFSPEVADAHLRGDIRLSRLEEIDRLHQPGNILLTVGLNLDNYRPGPEENAGQQSLAELDRALTLIFQACREKKAFLKTLSYRNVPAYDTGICIIEAYARGEPERDQWLEQACRHLSRRCAESEKESGQPVQLTCRWTREKPL